MNDNDSHSNKPFEPLMQELPESSAVLKDIRKAAETARRILEERKAEDIEIVDVTGKTSLVDLFVIASATSGLHIKSLSDAVEEGLEKEHSLVPDRIEGMDSKNWILLDYNDFVVHLMLPEQREFYDLEHLWSGFKTQRQRLGEIRF
ncbi:MAG: ribosome silencing factor [Saccharofermentanales bacterium]